MAPQAPFADWRVLELSNGIAVSYCAKMFADAGAEVVKIESPQGDSLRGCSAGGPPGALFGYLAAGKRSVLRRDEAEITALLAGTDIVLTDLTDGWTLDDITAHTGPSAVVVTVTPFGTTGPYVDDQVVANEFILQALCGSISGRGWPGDEPVQAGGRLGEWLAASFAAPVAAAAARHAARGGRGEIIDVSTYEAMAIAMGGLSAMSASVLGADSLLYQRSLELPSIVPTADGLVGFCTITAQQFQDFLIMIDRADMVDDAELASFVGRVERRDEFLGMVTQWTQTRTTQEILDLAVAFRIPVAPIGAPATLPTVDHFVQRGVFVESESGVLQPRVPYRSDAITTRPPGRAPVLGADNRGVHWPPRLERPRLADGGALPLSDIRITDFTAFWAGPVATQFLGALGADVIKLEGVRRPDGMRFSAGRPTDWDQWWEWGPVFLCSNNNKRGVSIELSSEAGRELALQLIAASDLVIENFSPRVMENFGLQWDAVRAANPRAVMVRMPAFGLDGPWRDRVGFAQTMEQATGMAWMTGHADGPPVIPRGVCDPIAGLHSAFAAIAALVIRDRDQTGIHVESTMVESALNVAAEMLLEYSRNGIQMRRVGNRGPGATPQGIYRCQGDDEWVALAALTDAARENLAGLLDRPELGDDEAGWRERADEIDKLIADWTARRPVADVVRMLRAAQVSAARVTEAAALLTDPQLLARGFWETVDHPVASSFLCTGMPFTFVGKPRRWIRRISPLYGQHTSEVLTGVLGYGEEDLAELRAAGVTSVRPAGL
ncbi:CaiB/BaiF CoA-transferase family protein [Mycobacterium montefiorense]|uniref:CoA transferase n=2 Tax=Mycobacterium montefiorense TaxID=154654 RepID=A0AA37PNQ1_9MYCO|nr:CoA transferase [Mycobacterium montefiorense]GBG37731.1 CoA transferase [Mycobacterium montefiorense]GKU34869.1 CoA transferase [Mycobacterium montefiorense]GKU40882.1 CoA transferase [Mycobacterium montefiorense]GKU46991.1 CoA transferase [Mycobacterium montefiorense]GKU49111.1 CoA transferase [Mycobacterium montefiorense]